MAMINIKFATRGAVNKLFLFYKYSNKILLFNQYLLLFALKMLYLNMNDLFQKLLSQDIHVLLIHIVDK